MSLLLNEMKDVIYLIHARDTDNYKIGITSQKNLDQRLKALQTGNSYKLVILKTVITKHASLVERRLHRDFKFVHQEGEWFMLSSDDVNGFELMCDKIINDIDFLVNMGNPFIIKNK